MKFNKFLVIIISVVSIVMAKPVRALNSFEPNAITSINVLVDKGMASSDHQKQLMVDYIEVFSELIPINSRLTSFNQKLNRVHSEQYPLWNKIIDNITKKDKNSSDFIEEEAKLNDLIFKISEIEKKYWEEQIELEKNARAFYKDKMRKAKDNPKAFMKNLFSLEILYSNLHKLYSTRYILGLRLQAIHDKLLSNEVLVDNNISKEMKRNIVKLLKEEHHIGNLISKEIKLRSETTKKLSSAFNNFDDKYLNDLLFKRKVIESILPETKNRSEKLLSTGNINDKRHSILLNDISKILENELSHSTALIEKIKGEIVNKQKTFLYAPQVENPDPELDRLLKKYKKISEQLISSVNKKKNAFKAIRASIEKRNQLYKKENKELKRIYNEIKKNEPHVSALLTLNKDMDAKISESHRVISELLKREAVLTDDTAKYEGASLSSSQVATSNYAQLGVLYENLQAKINANQERQKIRDIIKSGILAILPDLGVDKKLFEKLFKINGSRVNVDNKILDKISKLAAIEKHDNKLFEEFQKLNQKILGIISKELHVSITKIKRNKNNAGDKMYFPFIELLQRNLEKNEKTTNHILSLKEELGDGGFLSGGCCSSQKLTWKGAYSTDSAIPDLFYTANNFSKNILSLTDILFSEKAKPLEKRRAVIKVARLIKLPSKLFILDNSYTAVFGLSKGGVVMRGIGDPENYKVQNRLPYHYSVVLKQDFILNPGYNAGFLGDKLDWVSEKTEWAVGETFEAVGDLHAGAIEAVGKGINKAGDIAGKGIEIVGDAANDGLEFLGGKLEDAGNAANDFLQETGENITHKGKQIGQNIEALGNLIDYGGEALAAKNKVIGSIVEKFGETIEGTGSMVNQGSEMVGDGFKTVGDIAEKGGELANKGLDASGQIIQEGSNIAGDFLDKAGNVVEDTSVQVADFVDDVIFDKENAIVVVDQYFGDGDPENGFNFNLWKTGSYLVLGASCFSGYGSAVGCPALASSAKLDAGVASVKITNRIASEEFGLYGEDWENGINDVIQTGEFVYSGYRMIKDFGKVYNNVKEIYNGAKRIKELKNMSRILPFMQDNLEAAWFSYKNYLLPDRIVRTTDYALSFFDLISNKDNSEESSNSNNQESLEPNESAHKGSQKEDQNINKNSGTPLKQQTQNDEQSGILLKSKPMPKNKPMPSVKPLPSVKPMPSVKPLPSVKPIPW